MFNKTQSITNRKIIDNFSDLESLVNYIKSTKREEINHILEARKAGKGTNDYKNIKKHKLPCVIINFNHKNNYVNGSTVTNATDYLYLDIDNEESLGNLDLNYVSAYWKSLSNNGYSIIVKVKGLTKDNLKESYRYIGDKLDISYDTSAISVDRVTVLSYDANAYFSNNTEIIDLSEIIVDANKSTHYSNKEKAFLIGCDRNGDKIREDNLYEVVEKSNINVIYDENGIFDLGANNKISYSRSYPPFREVHEGEREKRLSSYICQFICLNRWIQKERVIHLANGVNNQWMKPKLTQKEIQEIVCKKYESKKTLKISVNAKRRFLYDPTFNLSANEKRGLGLNIINEERKEKSRAKIRIVLQNWDYSEFGKITQKKVIQITKMNKKTVGKYYTEILTEFGINKKSP